MALLEVTFASEVLGFSTGLTVLLPERHCPYPDEKWPVLYLLHGYGGDHTVWHRRTALERYVRDMDLAVVMPCVHNGFYTDMVHGPRYWTYVSHELPAVCERMFPISRVREGRFAAGSSMGGYGAMKLGLRLPQRYAAVASLSGIVDVAGYGRRHPEADPEKYFANVFGSLAQMEGSEDDLVAVAQQLLDAGISPPNIYMACGTEDFLYANNQRFVSAFQAPLSITYAEGPGAHEWSFWDAYIEKVLAWLPLP